RVSRAHKRDLLDNDAARLGWSVSWAYFLGFGLIESVGCGGPLFAHREGYHRQHHRTGVDELQRNAGGAGTRPSPPARHGPSRRGSSGFEVEALKPHRGPAQRPGFSFRSSYGAEYAKPLMWSTHASSTRGPTPHRNAS